MGPYNITQVDVPGLLSMYQGAQDRRLNQLLMQRKMALEDRDLQRQTSVLAAYSKLRDPNQAKGGDSPPAASAPSTSPMLQPFTPPPSPSAPDYPGIDRNRPMGSPLSPAGFPAAPAQPMPDAGLAPTSPAAPAAPAAPSAPAPASWVEANRDLVDNLLTIDPKAAFDLKTQLQGMDDTQIKKADRVAGLFAKVGEHLMSFSTPQAQKAELLRIKPDLVASGIPSDMIDNFQPTPASVQWLIVHGMDLDKVIAREKDDRQQTETERHNRADEDIGRASVGVKSGALDLARTREGRLAAGKAGSGERDSLIESLIAK